MNYYLLKGKTPRLVKDSKEWAKWYKKHSQQIDACVVGNYSITTVFIGIDHNFFGKGPPLLFETMVFECKRAAINNFTRRYSTWDEAQAGHDEIVKELKGKE